MKKILIIEDDLFIRENIEEILELSGYCVYSAQNGKEGLEAAFNLKPDLIICDIMMPYISGFEVKRKLDADSRMENIPFIFLTAKAEPNDLKKGMNLGADDFITKPFEVKQLLNSIRIRFEKQESMGTKAQTERC